MKTNNYKVGDYIYWTDAYGNHWPGKVVKLFKTRIQVRVNYYNGDRDILTWYEKIELQ